MKTAENQLLIFEGASAGQHMAAGAAWVDLPEANPLGRAERERREPRRSLQSSPKEEAVGRQRGKNRQLVSAQWVTEIKCRRLRRLRVLLAGPLLRIRYGSPLWGCSREAALSATPSCRNGLYAIKSVLP